MKPNDQITLVENLVATSQKIQEFKQASDEQVVRRKLPDAELVGWTSGAYAIFSREAAKIGDTGYIGWGQTKYNVSSTQAASEAWRDARINIDAPPVDIILVLGNWYYLDTGYRVDGGNLSYVKTEGK